MRGRNRGGGSSEIADRPGGLPEATLRGILDEMDELACLLGPDLVIRYANGAAGRALGRRTQELIGARLDELLPSPAVDLVRRSATECQRTGAAVSLELRAAPSGDDTLLSARIAPFSDTSQETHGLLLTGRDVTGAKRLEDELRRTRLELDGVFQAHPDLSFLISADGEFLRFHAGRSSDLYAPPETFVGKRVRDVLPPDVAELCERVLAGEHSAGDVIEYSLAMPSGHRFYEANVAPLSDGEYLFLVRDVTVRARSEQARVAASERLQVALSAAEMGIWEWDIRDNVIAWSDAALAMYGVTRDRFDGSYEEFLEMVHPDDRAALDAAVRAAVSAPPPRSRYEHEYRHVRADGTTRWHHASGSVLHDGGQPVLMLGAVRDVTEQRRLEEQLLHSQKMEAVGCLAGGIAHDFNNMLTAIMAGTSLAQIQMSDQDKARAHLADVQVAARKSSELTRQLLTFARMEVVEPQPIDLNELIRDATRLLRRLIGEHIAVETRLADDLWLLFADPNQMEQVLMNLVVNARDAMPEGGTIIIDTANVHLPEARRDLAPGDYVKVVVQDTGGGVDDAIRARIFEPFFTTKERSKGTGLGLATAYGIARQAGGNISLASEPGEGARFEVLLPARQGAGPRTSTRVDSEAPLGTEHILVVEDEDLVLGMIETILTAAGYRVSRASSAARAIALTRDEEASIQLLLTDIVMPHMSGRELVRQVRQQQPGIHVLYMSGYAADDANRGSAATLDAPFLPKPFSPDRLLRSVRHALDPPRPDPS